MAESGSVLWPSANEPLWRFNWQLADSPDEEGIAVTDAFYRNHQVFHKASLPVLRVQYHSPCTWFGRRCGPFKDPLTYDNAQPTERSGEKKVAVYSQLTNGRRSVVVESFHRVGRYRLIHRWLFGDDGHVYPRLFSAGIACPCDHRHHAYFRFDFDISGAGSDLVLEFNRGGPDEGWGAGWRPLTEEVSRVKNDDTDRSWLVVDKTARRGYFIRPGGNDGRPNSFSNRDLWLLRYHDEEDRHGRQGDAHQDGLEAYVNGESVDGENVVVWYAGHMFHRPLELSQEYHHAGPELVPYGPWGA